MTTVRDWLQKREKAAVKEGKQVYFPKRSEKKRQELVRWAAPSPFS